MRSWRVGGADGAGEVIGTEEEVLLSSLVCVVGLDMPLVLATWVLLAGSAVSILD